MNLESNIEKSEAKETQDQPKFDLKWGKHNIITLGRRSTDIIIGIMCVIFSAFLAIPREIEIINKSLGWGIFIVILFHGTFFIFGMIVGEIFNSTNEILNKQRTENRTRCPANTEISELTTLLRNKINELDQNVVDMLQKINSDYIKRQLDDLLKHDSKLFESTSTGNTHTGNILSKSSHMGEFKEIACELAKNAKKSLYITCIYPPHFWFTGNYLFNWEKFMDNPEDQKRLKKFYKYRSASKLPEPILKTTMESIEFVKKGNIIKALLEPNDDAFSIELKGNYALYKPRNSNPVRLAVKEVVKEDGKKESEVYSGDIKDIDYYKKYFALVNNLENVTKKRILIKGIYGNQEDWNTDSDNMKVFVKEYNSNVDLFMGSIYDIGIHERFFGDLMVIDNSVALIYDPHKTEPNGEIRGRLQIITGELIKTYVQLFESKDIQWEFSDNDFKKIREEYA